MKSDHNSKTVDSGLLTTCKGFTWDVYVLWIGPPKRKTIDILPLLCDVSNFLSLHKGLNRVCVCPTPVTVLGSFLRRGFEVPEPLLDHYLIDQTCRGPQSTVYGRVRGLRGREGTDETLDLVSPLVTAQGTNLETGCHDNTCLRDTNSTRHGDLKVDVNNEFQRIYPLWSLSWFLCWY